MKLLAVLACAGLALGLFSQGAAQEKSAADRTLKVKLAYTGTGAVDEKHPIFVFVFDSPDFAQGNVVPIATKPATSKGQTVTFSGVAVSPVYAAAIFDPTGQYDGVSGPPPSGSSMGMYSKNPPTPEPVKIEAGKTEQIELSFDDTAKMP